MPSSRRRTSDAATRALITKHISATYRKILAVVARIPRGHVMTYGDVAAAAGMPRAARVAGYALNAHGDRVPWQRVIGRKSARLGRVSIKDPVGGARQRQLLEKEGVRFGRTGSIDLEEYGWGAPPRLPPRAKPKARRK